MAIDPYQRRRTMQGGMGRPTVGGGVPNVRGAGIMQDYLGANPVGLGGMRGKRPPGFDRGRKVGWGGGMLPPGLGGGRPQMPGMGGRTPPPGGPIRTDIGQGRDPLQTFIQQNPGVRPPRSLMPMPGPTDIGYGPGGDRYDPRFEMLQQQPGLIPRGGREGFGGMGGLQELLLGMQQGAQGKGRAYGRMRPKRSQGQKRRVRRRRR